MHVILNRQWPNVSQLMNMIRNSESRLSYARSSSGSRWFPVPAAQYRPRFVMWPGMRFREQLWFE